MLQRYPLIVFDWDGTLFDSAGNIVRSLQAEFPERLHLLERDGEAGVPVAGFEGLGELGRTGDVGAFADDEEGGGGFGHGRKE